MPIAAPIINAFNGGEVSPLFYGRTDYPKYKSSVGLMQNFVPITQGGTTRRTGTYFINATKSNGAAQLIPFVFSSGDAFMLEFGDVYVRFYTGRAQVPDGMAPYEIVSPYAIADVPQLRFTQVADVLYIAHPAYPPQKLSRSGLTSWAFTAVSFLDGPYLKINTTATTLTPSSASVGSITITASAITGINNDTGFQTSDVGRLIRVQEATSPSPTWGWGIITARTDTTHVTVNMIVAAGATTATKVWRLGEWGSATGYPSVVFGFEDRLGWAASPQRPLTMNLSVVGDYENMAPTGSDSVLSADNALQLTLNAKQQDPIRWVIEDELGMLIGTRGAEYVAASAGDGSAMSAINFPTARRSTRYGSAFIDPLVIGKAVLFFTRTKRKIREMYYNWQVNGFQAPDLTALAEHATKGKLAQAVYQQEPWSIAWMRMEDGSLWGNTYDREQNVAAYHRHYLGGYSDAGQAVPPLVESIATIPSPDGGQDDLWLVVNRHVNGATARFIEYLTEFNSDYDSPSDCYFVDGGLTTTLGAVGKAVTGYAHLAGATIDLLVDGATQPPVVVANDGSFTLKTAGTVVTAGFGYSSRIKTLRPEAGSANGTAMGKTKRTHKLHALLNQTLGIRVGRGFIEEGVPVDQVTFRKDEDLMGQAVPLFSGTKLLDYEDDYTKDGYVCIEQVEPLPCTILALMPQLEVQDAA